MADGLNDARAMRVAEIMGDFRSLQHYIARIRAEPSPEEYYLEGWLLLRQCKAEAQSSLAYPFAASSAAPAGDPEKEKEQLRQVILDAGVRRFRCQRAYLRATAAMRWINSRNAILHGEKANAAHASALRNIDIALRSELESITDERVEYSLSAPDRTQGKWIVEDPSLGTIQHMIRQP